MSIPKMGALAVSISLRRSAATVCSRSSVCFRAEMSWPTPTTPIIVPLASLLVAAFSNTSTRSPSFVYSGNSKLAVSCPFKASSRTLLTDCLYSSLMKSSTSMRPIATSFSNPVISAAFWFHSLMCPFTSIPKMGALAVSISLRRSLATEISSVSIAFFSVISWPTATTPTNVPPESMRGVAFSKICTARPSFAYRGTSKLEMASPFIALLNRACIGARISGVMKSVIISRPSISSLLYPVSSAAL
mmetsp:Transcript_42787/g.76855  ORF Transcript_42787/g.76855 Transcript_42787/m.76855 type:complete len:246 (-) Transcript_42787:1337-2074(-)